jgi:hypothetical protein
VHAGGHRCDDGDCHRIGVSEHDLQPERQSPPRGVGELQSPNYVGNLGLDDHRTENEQTGSLGPESLVS